MASVRDSETTFSPGFKPSGLLQAKEEHRSKFMLQPSLHPLPPGDLSDQGIEPISLTTPALAVLYH